MASIGTGVNPLRSLVFVRNFGNQVIKKTDIKVRKRSGSLELTGINTKLTPQRIRFVSSKSLIKVQKNRSFQDRLIDIFV